MNRIILHIDFNSYFATVEQQSNPRLRGKPIGVTGGDRLERTVLGAASIEAKKLGVKTGMTFWEAKKLCPQIIIVKGDHDKYLEVTKRFINILKDYSDKLEIFSIDECFLEISQSVIPESEASRESINNNYILDPCLRRDDKIVQIAKEIKSRIKSEIGEVITCSIGISYNKLIAKLAGSLQKPDGLVVIPDEQTAIKVLDRVELDDICGIGSRIKNRLFNLGIRDFKTLRSVPKEALLASFKSYGEVLYNMSRGIDNRLLVPFFEREEVKSIGHRHTLSFDTSDKEEIKQILLKLSEMVARRLRNKKLAGRTIHCWFRSSLDLSYYNKIFDNRDMQKTISCMSDDGLEIFQVAWGIFQQIWDGNNIRMIGVSISNLKSKFPKNTSLILEDQKKEKILKTMDLINDKYGDFTLQRGSLLTSRSITRKPNPFLSDRRFRI